MKNIYEKREKTKIKHNQHKNRLKLDDSEPYWHT